MQVSARGYSQDKVSVDFKDAKIAKIFHYLERKSGYVFYYNNDELEKLPGVSLELKEATISQILDFISHRLALQYSILDNKLIIVRENTALLDVQNIRGKVVDTQGKALVGVSVQIKGTARGTATDAKGEFSIEAPDGATLVFSYLGYETKEVPFTGKTNLLVTLRTSETGLNEVVVVGYGAQKKSDLTGSISSIKGSEVTDLPTQRVDQALQGRAAGIMVLNTDGAPGGNTTIRIRGVNSINGGNNALIVIDGLQGGDLSSLNPSDIASIEILKDASATAIYGSQGANGVILITTKTGKKGKPVISYNYDIGFSKLSKKIPLLNAAQYAKNINVFALSNNGNGINPKPIFSDADIEGFEKNGGTDWQDVIYHTAITQNHQLSVSGATDKLSYRLSGAYLDQNGILLNSGYKRFSLRVNAKADITKWASFGLNWNGAKEKANSILFGNSTDWPNNPIGAALRFSPTIPIYDSTGNYSKANLHYGNPTLWNPLASTLEPLNDNNTLRNSFNAYLDFTILDGLTLRISGGAILTNEDNLSFLNTKTFIGLQSNGLGTEYTLKSEYYQNSNILTYDKTFNKHHLTVTAVAEQKYSRDYSSSIDASDFLNQQTSIYDFSGANIKTIGSYFSERVINSYMGRINYVYADKYLLTASYRADGSSVFGKNNKWGFFPSAAVAWRAFQEDFIKRLNIFSDLKVRASWGITGNQAISPYQTLARISSGADYNYPYDGGDATNLGFIISSAANPNLKWESTSQVDFGLDIGVLGGRLTFTGDYYKKTTKNLLMPRELPSYTGLTSITDNVGSIGNKGIEIAVAGDPVAGSDFSWHSGFQIAANRTTVINLGRDNRIGYKSGGSGQGVNSAFMYLVDDEPFGQMFGWKYEGVWKESQAKEAAAYGQLPGDPHYADINQDGKIDMNDTTVIGNSMPKFIFGWSNQITYKNFNLTFLIQGKQGNDIFNVARIALDAPDGTSVRLLNRWTPENQDSDIPGIIDARTRENAHLVSTISFPPSTGNTLSRYIEDGSYVRLKNVTLAYNLPATLMHRIKFNNASVYVSATNLVTLTKYTGYDPEVSSFNGNDAQIGSDYNNYPSSRTFNIGLKVSF
jgi:TonB-linked SusC/RagA family outer membrane protein